MKEKKVYIDYMSQQSKQVLVLGRWWLVGGLVRWCETTRERVCASESAGNGYMAEWKWPMVVHIVFSFI